jgi:DNA-binding NarL/FixJ family response regulator
MSGVRCVLGDRSVFFTEGLTSVLRASGEVAVVGRTHDPGEVPRLVEELSPDLAVVSFEPPSAAIAVARQLWDVPVLVLTWSRREDDLFDAMRAGATGFVHKDVSAEELISSIHAVAAGRTAFPAGWERMVVNRLDNGNGAGASQRRQDPVSLTQRERDIVQLIVDGHSNKALASALGIAHQTAKNHVRHVMAKVRVNSRVQLCAWAIERGYAPTKTAATA